MIEVGVRYVPKPGAHISRADAQAVGEALEALAGMDGVGAEEVVEAAADESSPLHPHFEWDDEVAAHKWRCWEARHLLHSVEVVVSEAEDGEEPETVRAFHVVSLTTDDDTPATRRYMTLDVVTAREDFAEQVVQKAKDELRSFRKKYSRYQRHIRRDEALSRAFDAIHGLDD